MLCVRSVVLELQDAFGHVERAVGGFDVFGFRSYQLLSSHWQTTGSRHLWINIYARDVRDLPLVVLRLTDSNLHSLVAPLL